MSTKIDGSGERYTPPVSRSAATRADTAGVASRAAQGHAPRGDAISLTQDAQLIGEARTAALNASAVDTRRVDAVRQALRDGSYQVDARALATQLLKAEWELS